MGKNSKKTFKKSQNTNNENKTLPKTIYFQEIILKNKKYSRPDLKSVFKHIESLEPNYTKNGRYEKSKGKYISIYVDHISDDGNCVKCRLGGSRKDNLPWLEKNGRTIPLPIDKDTALYDPVHFIIWKEQYGLIIGYEYNHNAPRISNLLWYLPTKANNIVNSVKMYPLYKSNLEEKLNNYEQITLLDVQMHRNMVPELKNFDKNLYKAFDTLEKAYDSKYIHVTLNIGKEKKSLKLNSKEKLIKWIKEKLIPESKDVKTLKIGGRVTKSSNVEVLDFLNQYILSHKTVAKRDKTHNAVDTQEMYSAIDEAYKERYNEISGIMDRG
ncbi:hypothetical protein [Methanococcus maripaludis]|uniref:Uncharacterized protein n=1 Tax=Methanococcus maripaludis TaxID=39152 RepID=A0A7J9SCH3_METMI|nr:hypothetical protein [Methanococcus maripaludis]MBB6497788.1 hypothetical protein [Methanococcus maripaludis]